MGNAGHCNSKTIKGLANGKYYWSVQAIDNAFEGSSFAAEKSFTIPAQATPDITQQPVNHTVMEGESISFKVKAFVMVRLVFNGGIRLGDNGTAATKTEG